MQGLFQDTQADSNSFHLDEYVKLSCQAPDKNPCNWREIIKQSKKTPVELKVNN